MPKLFVTFAGFALAAVAAACTVESDPPRVHQTGNPAPPASGNPDAVLPAVVEIDADRTLSAEGGKGVGVFVEYASTGQWHVFWTCDTLITGQSCTFLLDVDGLGKPITYEDQTGEAFEFESVTTTEIHEFTIDAEPGADLQLRASIGGVDDSRYFFFVQNGVVNGDYQGSLTNPLIFRPKTATRR